MDVIKCNLPKLVKDFADGISTFKSEDLNKILIQNYINKLNCNTKEIICVEKYDTKCIDTVRTECNLYIKDIAVQIVNGVITLTPTILNSNGTITYTWDFDSLYTLEPGYTVNSPILKIRKPDGSLDLTFTFSLTINDSKCNFSKEYEVSICEECLNPDLTISYEDCWRYIGNDDYLLKITPNFSCSGIQNYNDYLLNIYVSSPDISIVKDIDNFWNLKVKNVDTFKALNCGDNGKIYFGKSNAREIYEYNPITGDATFKLALPSTVVYNHPTMGSMTLPLNSGDGDIAVSANKIFFINWFTAPDPTGTFPMDYSFVGRYDINWNTLALSNFTMIAEPSGVNYTDGFSVSLEAVSDNLVLVDWYQGAVSGGFLPATQNEVREYNFTLLTNTTFINTISTFNNLTGCNDIAFDGTHVYMLMVDFSIGASFTIRKFNYTTKALVASSTPISFSITAQSPPGIAVLDGKVYVAEDFGNVLVYDAITLSYLYNKDITNINIRGTVPPLPPTDAISGFAQIPSSASTNLEIDYSITYNECGISKTATLTEDFPCSIPVCCEDCELDLDVVFSDCYKPHDDGGIVGGAVEVTITSNGCVNVNDIDFLTATVTDTTLSSTNLLKFVKIDNKWHILSSENSWPAGMINISFGYTVCGVSKNYSANFGRNDITQCCTDCPEENAFTVTIADCYENIAMDGIYILANYVINCAGWTNSSAVTVAIRKNGVQIGTMIPYLGGYRMRFSTNDFSEICGVELELVSKIDNCIGDPTWFYNTLIIPCNLPLCEPCVDCDNEGEASYNINVNELCWSENTGTSKYEALIPNVFTCNGKTLKVKSITVISTNGCQYHTIQINGLWYLTVDKACADATPGANLTLRVCWNDCD